MERKFPVKLFVVGVIMDFFLRFFLLFLLGIGLCVAGIWVDICGQIGGVVLLLDLVISVADQISIARAVMNGENSDLNAVMDAFEAPDGMKSVREVLEERMCSGECLPSEEEEE